MLPKHTDNPVVYTHALNGWVFLTSTSTYDGVDVGQSPEGEYVAIIVLEDNTAIEDITFSNDNYEFAPGQGIADVPLIAGNAYPALCTQVKLSGGSVLLVKES